MSCVALLTYIEIPVAEKKLGKVTHVPLEDCLGQVTVVHPAASLRIRCQMSRRTCRAGQQLLKCLGAVLRAAVPVRVQEKWWLLLSSPVPLCESVSESLDVIMMCVIMIFTVIIKSDVSHLCDWLPARR